MVVTPFKFGKKKPKDQTPTNTPSRDTSFPSPSSATKTNINHSSNNNNNNNNNSNNNNYQSSPQSSNHSLTPQRKNSNTLTAEPANSIQYDQNNNLRSPQRPQQYHQQQPPHSYRGTQTPPRQPSGPLFQQPALQPWTKSKLLISPFPRYRHTASTNANDKGEIFVMGGLHNTSVYGDTWIIKQDSESKHFQTLQVEITDNSPVPRVGHASTTCGNAYVIFGGDTVSNQDGEIDNDLYLFNMNSHTWSVPKPINKKPSGRYGHKIGVIALTNFDSKVYLFGGQLDDVIFDDLVVFNLSSFRRPDVQWEWVTPASGVKPAGLTNHTMDVYDNKLWVFGGFNGKSLTNDLWCYDPIPNKWQLVKTVGMAPPPLEEQASVIYKDLLIIHGGKKSDGEASRDIFFYHFDNRSWFQLPSSYTSFPGKFGHTISILKGDKLVLLGGQLPDYSKIGDPIEPSMDDQGLGTVLNIFDLSILNRLIPGLEPQDPLTPKNQLNQERFNSNPGSASTPPQQFQKQQLQQQQPNNLQSPVSINITSALPQSKAPIPDFKGHQRVLSAEDIFQRDQQQNIRGASHFAGEIDEEDQSGNLDVDAEDTFSKESPLQRKGIHQEEELPLQLPSPINTKTMQFSEEHKIDGINPPDFKESESLDRGDLKSKDNILNVPTTTEEARRSDIFDNYTGSIKEKILSSDKVHQLETTEPVPQVKSQEQEEEEQVSRDPTVVGTGISAVGSGIAKVGVAGVVGVAGLAGLAAGVFAGKEQKVQPAEPTAAESKIPATKDILTIEPIKPSVSTPIDSDEKQQFKGVIGMLSTELENLKASTNEKIQAASDKITKLEEENHQLKQQQSKQVEVKDETVNENENETKRRNRRLNSDYTILTQSHSQLQSQFEEMKPIFSDNLIQLAKLNDLIKEQSEKITAQRKEIEEQENWKLKYEELQTRYSELEAKNLELKKSNDDKFYQSEDYIKQLNTGLDLLLGTYVTKNEGTGELQTKEISTKPGVNGSNESDVITCLRSEIESLIVDNETFEAKTNTLTSEIEDLKKKLDTHETTNKSLSTEIEQLKAKEAELVSLRAKLTELDGRYKESLHSVTTTSRALQLSESELSRQRDLNKTLLNEIEEIKFKKSGSRNATPIINDFKRKQPSGASPATPTGQSTEHIHSATDDEEDEDDFANSHYNLKIKDLQAELYIIKQERDELKENVLKLKKDLFIAAQKD